MRFLSVRWAAPLSCSRARGHRTTGRSRNRWSPRSSCAGCAPPSCPGRQGALGPAAWRMYTRTQWKRALRCSSGTGRSVLSSSLAVVAVVTLRRIARRVNARPAPFRVRPLPVPESSAIAGQSAVCSAAALALMIAFSTKLRPVLGRRLACRTPLAKRNSTPRGARMPSPALAICRRCRWPAPRVAAPHRSCRNLPWLSRPQLATGP